MATKHLDRMGREITKSEWLEKRGDPAYKIVKEFDNGFCNVTLEWIGEIRNCQNLFDYCYPVFEMQVWNYDGNKVPRQDPVDSGKTFANERDALAYYEEFLTRYAGCRMEEDQFGEKTFVEEGNVLTPPPPPDLNVPVTETDDEVGAW